METGNHGNHLSMPMVRVRRGFVILAEVNTIKISS
jgi:hypothetical protein